MNKTLSKTGANDIVTNQLNHQSQTSASSVGTAYPFIVKRAQPQAMGQFEDSKSKTIVSVNDILQKHKLMTKCEAPSVVAQWTNSNKTTMLHASPHDKPNQMRDQSLNSVSPLLSGSTRRKRSAVVPPSFDFPAAKKPKYGPVSTSNENNSIMGNSFTWTSTHHPECKCKLHPDFTLVATASKCFDA